MSTLYVTEPGTQVHKRGERLLLQRGGEVVEDIPMLKIERVVLMGRGVSITTPTLYELTRRNVDVVYLSSRGGFISRLMGREHGHSRLRQTQAIAAADMQVAMRTARQIVAGKINNQRVLVQRHAGSASWVSDALARMDAMRRDLDEATTLDELRGREGLAAKDYFALMRSLLRPPADGGGWGFETRQYYPPPDPINALLSYGYTLLLHDLVSACQLSGLDPDLGFFHAIDYNKPSMALDLEEEFRPLIVDSIILTAINRPVFRKRDFEVAPSKHLKDKAPGGEQSVQNSPRPVYLKKEARRNFIALYEGRVNETVFYPPDNARLTYRQIFRRQAYQMANFIMGKAPDYVAFTVR